MKTIFPFLVLLLSAAGILPAQTNPPDNPKPDAPTASTGEPVVKLDNFVVTDQLDQSREEILPGLGASTFTIDRAQIDVQPLGPNASFNQVILRMPGAAQDSFGQLHLRGEHGNLQYRLNDVLLPEGISGFGQELDTRFIDTASVLTGSLPAQYGYRTAGVVDIHTKNGSFHDGVIASLYGGSYNTIQPSIQAGGTSGAVSYYVSGSYNANDLGVENPTPEPTAIHDHTTQGKAFAYVSDVIDATSRLSVIASASVSNFEIPNNPGQTPAFVLEGVPTFDSAQLDENQRETNGYAIVAYQKSAGGWDGQIAAFVRNSGLKFTPDHDGDLIFNGVASQVDRTIRGYGLEADFRRDLGDRHTLRTGVIINAGTATEDSVTSVFPVDEEGNQTSTVPFDIPDSQKLRSTLYGVYLQDEWKLTDTLTVNYGARADAAESVRNEGQLSPRINFNYQPNRRTTIHAGYARYFTPPPLELVESSDLALFEGTTNAPAVTQNSPVLSERSDYFDVGVKQELSKNFSVGVDGYLKNSRRQLDEGQFGSALIFSPFNYDRGRITGTELTANYTHGAFSTYANFAISRAMGKDIISGEFQFDPGELAYIADNWVHLDHDQTYTGSFGASYKLKSNLFYLDLLYGSGLRRGFANTESLPAYYPLNLGFEHKFHPRPHTEVALRLDIVNVFDEIYELRDGSGIGVGAPQFGMRRGFFGGVSCSF
jgi:TonB dependent receptor